MPSFRPAIRRRFVRKTARRAATKKRFPRRSLLGFRPTMGRNHPRAMDSVVQQNLVVNPWMRYPRTTFPPSLIFHEKFTDIERVLSITTAGVASNSVVYRLNSMFDPYFAAGGGEPEWFSTISNIYSKYVVWGVDIHIRAYAPTLNTLVVGATVQASTSTDDPASKTADYYMQRRDYATLPMTSTTGQGSCRECMQSFKIHELDGISFKKVTDDPNYCALVGANPTNNPFLRIGCADLDGNATGSTKVVVSLTFHGKYYDIKQST